MIFSSFNFFVNKTLHANEISLYILTENLTADFPRNVDLLILLLLLIWLRGRPSPTVFRITCCSNITPANT